MTRKHLQRDNCGDKRAFETAAVLAKAVDCPNEPWQESRCLNHIDMSYLRNHEAGPLPDNASHQRSGNTCSGATRVKIAANSCAITIRSGMFCSMPSSGQRTPCFSSTEEKYNSGARVSVNAAR